MGFKRNSLDIRDDAVLQLHPLVNCSEGIVHVEVDNSTDHDLLAVDEVVEAGIDSGNNPPQHHHHHLREVYHVPAVVDHGVDSDSDSH